MKAAVSAQPSAKSNYSWPGFPFSASAFLGMLAVACCWRSFGVGEMRALIVGPVVTLIAVVRGRRRLLAKSREGPHRQDVRARGRRYTKTIPAGAAGRDAPFVNTVEGWTALACQLNGLIVWRQKRSSVRGHDPRVDITQPE